MLSFTKAPITMEATETRVKFSGPESSVEMEVMKGFNGKAVKVMNLPSAVFQDYTQFRSVSHTHSSATHSWSHKGTNGFTSKWEAGRQIACRSSSAAWRTALLGPQRHQRADARRAIGRHRARQQRHAPPARRRRRQT